MPSPARTEEEITTVLMGLVAWAGQVNPAAKYLRSEHGINIAPATLKEWMTGRYADRFEELREKHADKLEAKLANDMRDVAALALEAERLAIEKAKKALEDGTEKDPARASANLARVAQSSVDKLMTLTARPQTYTDTRDPMEIMRGLVALGVLKAPEEPKQIEGAAD